MPDTPHAFTLLDKIIIHSIKLTSSQIYKLTTSFATQCKDYNLNKQLLLVSDIQVVWVN